MYDRSWLWLTWGGGDSVHHGDLGVNALGQRVVTIDLFLFAKRDG
ncbi:hypothetical protein ACNKHO_00705 [Shigella flexneri]